MRRHRRRSGSRRHQGLRADQMGGAAGRLQGLHQGPVQGQQYPDRGLSSASSAPRAAKDYVREHGAPIVVKADGLAAGKGVVVAADGGRGRSRHRHDVRGGFGEPAWEIVIEDCLVGEEASFFALCDGETALPLASAQDHKRVGDGDKGPNTGGMGAYSPAPVMTRGDEQARDGRDRPADRRRAQESRRALQGRAVRRADDHQGRPAAHRIQCPLRRSGMPGADAAADVRPGAGADRGARRPVEELRSALVCRRRAHRGDGGQGLSRRHMERARSIEGLDEAAQVEGVEIFHAGTHGATAAHPRQWRAGAERLRAGGKTVREAQARAYAAVDRIDWPEGFCRRDIGWRAVEREQNNLVMVRADRPSDSRLGRDCRTRRPVAGRPRPRNCAGTVGTRGGPPHASRASAIRRRTLQHRDTSNSALPPLPRFIFIVHGSAMIGERELGRRRSLAGRARGHGQAWAARRHLLALGAIARRSPAARSRRRPA